MLFFTLILKTNIIRKKCLKSLLFFMGYDKKSFSTRSI